eukprot:TRINITY_DN19985_c0_g1_i3.p4 TRINITY_DN19985_c0_g1~~TRINITY_DN19985_c0_g1_i3.p4  ORF type:complete len:110 (-),score=7.45 TRINITY_DN19985_c0_g1_i3:273-602(-)
MENVCSLRFQLKEMVMVEAIEVSEVEFWNTVQAYKNKSEFDATPVDFLYLTDDPSEFDIDPTEGWYDPAQYDDSAYQLYADVIPFQIGKGEYYETTKYCLGWRGLGYHQ